MDTRHLRYFVAVAEERHFGRAAERLHMAQPPLSQQIKQFEDQLGTKLFIRTTRRVELTAAGQMLLTRARALLQEHDQLARDVRTVGNGASGVLRLGSTGTATYRVMPQLIELTSEHMPGLQLNVQGEMLTPEMEEALAEGRLDVAILRPPLHNVDIEYSLLEKDLLSVALPADHPLAERSVIDLHELRDEKFICYPQFSAVNTISMAACRAAGFVPNTAQVARETSTLLTFVAAGIGIGLIPTTVFLPHSDQIVFLPLRDAPAIDLAIAWKAGSTSALVKNFLTLCTALAPEEGSHE